MGYKRMKKRDKRKKQFEKSLMRLGFRKLGIEYLGVRPNHDKERIRWFESPNASGYLDM